VSTRVVEVITKGYKDAPEVGGVREEVSEQGTEYLGEDAHAKFE